MAIKHIGHAIKATSQHSSSLTNFTFPLTLSINLLLFYLPYVLTQHVITVQNTSLLPWHATFACQLLWRTCDQSVILFFSARDHLKHPHSLPKRQTLSPAKASHHISYLGFHVSSMSLNQSYRVGFTKGKTRRVLYADYIHFM